MLSFGCRQAAAVQLRHVCEGVFTQRKPGGAYENAHGTASVPVLKVRQAVCDEAAVDVASEETRRRTGQLRSAEQARVRRVWQLL